VAPVHYWFFLSHFHINARLGISDFMKNTLILLLLLSSTVFAGREALPESDSNSSLAASGGLSLLFKQLPARNEIKQIPGTKFLPMQDLDGDGWRDDSPTPEHVLVTTNSFPQCNDPYDLSCYKTGNAFGSWVGGAYSPIEHRLRVLAGGGHADGGSNAVYALNLETLTPSRETDPSPLDGPFMLDKDGDRVNESCPYPSDAPPASHTYDGVVDLGDKVLVTGLGGFCKNDMSWSVGFWFYHKNTRTWEQLTDLSTTGGATRSGYDAARNVVYLMDNDGFREFDLATYELRFLADEPEWLSTGRGVGHFDPNTRNFYFTEDELWSVHVDLDGTIGSITKIDSAFNGYFVQNIITGVLWSWDCGTTIKSYDPATGQAISHTPAAGEPLNTGHRPYSKMMFIEELGVLACIDDPEHGLYLYNPPDGPYAGPAQVIPVVDSTVPTKLIYHESFESATWYSAWSRRPGNQDLYTVTPKKVVHVSQEQGCWEGNCTRISIPQFSCCGISIYYPIPGNRENVTLEYYMKLAPNWSPVLYNANGPTGAAGGKLPGLSDNRVWPDDQCGNGGAQSDGINCWSMRAKFDDCAGTNATCGDKTRYGGYLYYPEANDFWGLFAAFDDEPADKSGGIGRAGQLENDRWYHVKMQVVMNTPGHRNGVIRGWVDGELSFEQDDFLFRFEGHDNLHVRNVWFNVYFGGQSAGPKEDTYVLFDELVIKGR